MSQSEHCAESRQHSSKKETFLAPPNLDVISELLSLAKTGIFTYFFTDAKLNELASQISILFAENAYLKKLVSLVPAAPKIDTSANQVTIAFGPNNEYTLMLPVTGKQDRMQLADQLFYAALALKRQEIEYDKQQKLPFSN